MALKERGHKKETKVYIYDFFGMSLHISGNFVETKGLTSILSPGKE